MCYSHLDHNPGMKLHETEARARELAAGIKEDRQTLAALGQLIARGAKAVAGLVWGGGRLREAFTRQVAE